ncbi:MAG: thiamine pyrophosphate-dependent enzyme, partial [Rhizomicrobium sp.]
AVHDAMSRALEHCRPGTGPYALEIRCYRFLGHFVGDPQAYRTQDELRDARAHDPLPLFRKKVTDAKLLDGAELDAIEKEVLAEVDDAAKVAIAASPPDIKSLEKDVYVRY